MAKKVNVTLVDDLDGDSPADETVEFCVDGVSYQIDLSTKNAERFRTEIGVWIGSARKVSGRFRGRRPATTGEDLAAVRDWARNNGMEVHSRGRVPGEIITAFHNRGAVKSDQERAAKALSKVNPVDKPEFSEN